MNFLGLIKEHLALPKIGGVLLSGFALTSIAQSNLDYTAVPPLSQQFSNDPMVMLALASDHQLFIRAYNEYDDLDLDGEPESSYSHSFTYVGYFDPKKCYAYAVTDGLASTGTFVPTSTAPTVPDFQLALPAEKRVAQYCPDNEWSGNFLNWLTMTRADIVRLVLYGGYRSTDTEDKTILERAFLPSDAHSFAKYYDDKAWAGEVEGEGDIRKLAGFVPTACSGDHCAKGYTFCNTSAPKEGNHLSHDPENLNQPPLLRMVKGNYSFWGSGERYQCLTSGELKSNGNSGNPSGVNVQVPGEGEMRPAQVLNLPIAKDSPATSAVRDFIVRVDVCGQNSQDGAHNCRAYGENKKPVGILQEIGSDGIIKFGLMSRGYNTNKSFGVLRKNISSFADEINDDGTFKAVGDEISESIVGALDAFRLVDYRYDYTGHGDNNWRNTYYRGTYLRQIEGVEFWSDEEGDVPYNFRDPDNANYDCTWGRNFFENGECRNWGNPFSELMAESYRYLAGADVASVTDETRLDNNLIPGLKVAPWNPPTRAPDPESGDADASAEDLACVNMNVLAFNASAVSYDGDELADVTPAFLGIGTDASSGTISDLTNFIGVQEGISGGTYFVGAVGDDGGDQQCTAKEIANFADVRGTCPDAPRLEGSYLVSGLAHFVKTRDMLDHVPGKNTISTYGVRMAGDLPRINIDLGNNRSATLIPACHNEDDGGNCALVDFKKLSNNSYFISWEDSEQGGDYDQDLNGVIRYRVIGDTLEIDTRVYQVSTRKKVYFSYVLSGVGSGDGLHKTSMIDDQAIQGCPSEAAVPACETFRGATDNGDWQQKRFTLTANAGVAGGILKDPLWYAAKWGGFTDENQDADEIPVPDLDVEWKGADGNPKGYTLVRNPSDLSGQLTEAIKGLIKRPASGSGAAVASNTLAGEGLLLQAAYKPEVASGSDKVSWVGVLNGLFFDAFGNVREDSNNNQKLDALDNIIQIYYDSTAKDTLVRRMPFEEDIEDIADSDIVSGLSLESIKPVWSARDQLANLNNTQKAGQRTYSASAGTGRYIFTSVDKPAAGGAPPDGITTGTEVIDFNAAAFDGTNTTDGLGFNNYRLLGVDQTEAGKVVDFIRGVEGIEGFRNRTVNYNGIAPKPWILGDIVHSTPAVVGRPSAGYNVSYSDQTYTAFRNHYLNRRQVAYVGANDGMLHAFNMGVYDDMSQSFSPSGHPLGAELWAYVPYNLLPHLKWLTQPDYSHVYYVDSTVKAYDVNIFPSTGATGRNPYGWGTIIVVGMRFGGGEYEVNIDDEIRKLRSAYMIFDVTNPEEEPTLIAEITHEDMGFTIAEPELVHFRQGKTSGGFITGEDQQLQRNDWYLVFGNGPTDLEKGISDKPAKLFYLNLKQVDEGLTPVTVTTSNGHIGGLRVVDWNGDYQDDQLYISVVGDGSSNNLGSLHDAPLASDNVIGTVRSLLTDVNAPFSVPVLPVRNLETGDFWVFAGSGRLLVSDDLENNYQGSYYGIKVRQVQENGERLETPVSRGDLYDVTDHSLYENEVLGSTMVRNQDGLELGTIEEFQLNKIDVDGKRGWYRTFARSNESNFVPTSLLRTALLINTYTPGISDCEPLGKSYLYALNAFNGLADASLGNLVRGTADGAGYKKVEEIYGETAGVAMNVTLTGNESGVIPASTGGLTNYEYDVPPTPGGRRSWTEIPLDILH